MNAFLSDLESGKCDPDLNEPRQDAEPLSPLVSKDGAVNGDAAQTNGSAGEANVIPEDSKPSGSADDAMQFNVEPDEDTNEQDVGRADANGNGRQVSDSKRPVDRGEELSIPPEGNQVMIRTIPPDIGRVKLEEVSLSMLCIPLC